MHLCPRCQTPLRSAEKDHFCPNHHGALLTLTDFQQETNRKFTKWFFSSWLRFGNKRTIQCPECSTKMIQLTVEGKTTFELDCCPSCFALWLDSGEDVLLYKLFQKQMEMEKIRDLTSEQHQILAKIVLQQDSKLQRWKSLGRWGRLFSKNLRVYPRSQRARGFFLLSMLFDDDKDSKN